MSATNENLNNQELNGGETTMKLNGEEVVLNKKAARKAAEQEERRKQKRSNLLYIVIGAVFALALIFAIVWNSGVIQKNSTAVSIDGEQYTADEVRIYYLNAYSSFMNQNSSYAPYLGLDSTQPLQTQYINESAAMFLGMDITAAGKLSWHDYFIREGVEQMSLVQNTLAAAEKEGFVYPDSLQKAYEESIGYVEIAASYSGVSVDEYLSSYFGFDMEAEVYYEEMLRMMQVDAYMAEFASSLVYSEEEMEAAYAADPRSYDKGYYEYLAVSGNVSSTNDEEGNTVEPTQEERDAAMEAARAKAEELLAEYKKGGKEMSELKSDTVTHYKSNGTAYYDGILQNWVFDESRKAGDTAVLEAGTTCYVVQFNDRAREEYNTVNVRHILVTPAAGELAEGDEGYEDEQAKLNAEAEAKAQELLEQWKSGDATEDSFAQLANTNSADSDGTDGGLYSQVYRGQMVTEFNNWCFDAGRKVGDTGIVETTYGYHVMYFAGEDLPYWKVLVNTDLTNEAYNEYVEELSAGSTVKYHNFGLGFVK